MHRLQKRALVVVLSLLLLASVPAAHASSTTNPRVFPPNARPHGQTYNEWSAKWWQYYFALPAAENPLIDPTGKLCHVGLHNKVGIATRKFGCDGTD
jgi:hypothetical protein